MEDVVLEAIRDGCTDSEQLFAATDFSRAQIRDILRTLERKGLVQVSRKADDFDELWECSITQKPF